MSQVVGGFRPTAKNAMVKDFFQRFGFAPLDSEASGATTWGLDVTAYAPRATHISDSDR